MNSRLSVNIANDAAAMRTVSRTNSNTKYNSNIMGGSGARKSHVESRTHSHRPAAVAPSSNSSVVSQRSCTSSSRRSLSSQEPWPAPRPRRRLTTSSPRIKKPAPRPSAVPPKSLDEQGEPYDLCSTTGSTSYLNGTAPKHAAGVPVPRQIVVDEMSVATTTTTTTTAKEASSASASTPASSSSLETAQTILEEIGHTIHTLGEQELSMTKSLRVHYERAKGRLDAGNKVGAILSIKKWKILRMELHRVIVAMDELETQHDELSSQIYQHKTFRNFAAPSMEQLSNFRLTTEVPNKEEGLDLNDPSSSSLLSSSSSHAYNQYQQSLALSELDLTAYINVSQQVQTNLQQRLKKKNEGDQVASWTDVELLQEFEKVQHK